MIQLGTAQNLTKTSFLRMKHPYMYASRGTPTYEWNYVPGLLNSQIRSTSDSVNNKIHNIAVWLCIKQSKLETILVISLWATQKLFWFNGSSYVYMNKNISIQVTPTYFEKTTLLLGLHKVDGFNTVHRLSCACMISVCWFQLHAW